MTRNALFTLAGIAVVLAAPLAAQSTGTGAAGQPAAAAAQPSTAPSASTAPAASTTAAAPANSDDPNAQSTDPKADPKAKAKATGGTVVRAGPNAGMVIGGKTKKPKDNSDGTQKADEQQSPDKCTANPCK